MIENLNGIHEKINYKESTHLRLYVNDECEHYPPHWHTAMEIICPLKDGYHVTCNDNTYHLRTQDILFICPGVIHDLPEYPTGVRIIFQAESALLQSIRELETILTLMAPALLITPEKFPDVHQQLFELMMQIQDEYQSNHFLSEGIIYAYLLEMMVRLGRANSWMRDKGEPALPKRQEHNEKMLAVCSYISEHCTESISLDEAAAKIGFSKYHFERLFKQFTGMSYYKYLTCKRIAHAERLLIDPAYTITEAALQSGFSSLTAFTRMFKMIKQCTPTEFRNMGVY